MEDIIVLDEHHEVMIYWERIKHILPKTVVHVDFHADMWAPGKAINYQYAKSPGYLNNSVYSNDIYKLVEEDISPTSFLIPSVLRYRFQKVVFLRPTGICEPTRKITIGTLNGEGKIIRNVDSSNKDFFPDAIAFEYSETNNLNDAFSDDYVLDIDLDYFCCNLNPVSYKDIFIKYPDKIQSEIIKINTSRDEFGINMRIIDIDGDGNYLIPQPDFLVRYNDNLEWIRYSIERFVCQLQSRPKFISICRSEKLGYTPKEYVQFIEKYLKDMLNASYVNMVYPMDVSLELTVFSVIKGRRIYNYCTEVGVEMDDVGAIVIDAIKREKATTRDIIRKISEYYHVSEDLVSEDIKEYIWNLRALQIVS